MKKFIIAVLLTVTATTSAFAGDSRTNIIAAENFKRDFKNATNVQWQSYGNHTFAIFEQEGEVIKAYYNQDGELYGTSRAVNTSNLPLEVKRSLSKNYSNYVVEDAIKFDGMEDSAYFLTAHNEKFNVVLKYVDGVLLLHKKTTKK